MPYFWHWQVHAGDDATTSLEKFSKWLDGIMWSVESDPRDSRWYYGSVGDGLRGIQRSHFLWSGVQRNDYGNFIIELHTVCTYTRAWVLELRGKWLTVGVFSEASQLTYACMGLFLYHEKHA